MSGGHSLTYEDNTWNANFNPDAQHTIHGTVIKQDSASTDPGTDIFQDFFIESNTVDLNDLFESTRQELVSEIERILVPTLYIESEWPAGF